MSKSRSEGMSSSSKREMEPFKNRVKIIDSEQAFDTSKTEPYWAVPEFGDLTDIQNVNEATCHGTIAPAGTMFPLGAAIPCDTVLIYGAYFPAGTMFPDGVLVPIHSRLVSVIPLKTASQTKSQVDAVGCPVQ